jgi:hypothetical protein
MSFRIIKPLLPRKNNTQLQFKPPVKQAYIPPPLMLKGSIIKSIAYNDYKSFVVGNLYGNKIVPDLSGNFGWSVECDNAGRYTVIGAPAYASMTGFAKIYSIQNNVATLLYTSSEIPNVNNMIGFSVSISGNGNVIAVGVPGFNGNRGSVLIYSNNNGSITYSQNLIPNSVAVGDYAGQFVKLNSDGTVLAIGAPLASTNAGKVWIYKYINSSWTYIQTITNPVGVSYFGDAIAMTQNGEKIAVTSKRTITGGINCQAYCYNYSSSSGLWSVSNFTTLSITTSLAINSVDFDIKISDSGRYLVLSSPNQNDTSGIVTIYTLSATDISLYSTSLSPSTGETGFGYKLSISGDGKTIYVSSASNDTNEGEIWIYRQSDQSPTSWIRVLQPFRGTNDIGQPQQGFSIACNFDGSVLVIGGPFDNNNKGASWSFV